MCVCVCVCVLSDVAVICVTLSGVIGRAKRAPHWAVQLIFRVIYIYVCRSVCLKETHTKNWYVKMRGRNYVALTRACSKSVLDGVKL